MDREVSIMLEISVTLIALAAVLTLVFYTVFMGNEMRVDTYAEAARIESDLQVGQLDDMIGQENEMTTAAAYSLMRTYGKAIPYVKCYVEHSTEPLGYKESNLVTDTPCLLEHMTGKVTLEVTQVNDAGYHIIVHSSDCPWYYSSCNED